MKRGQKKVIEYQELMSEWDYSKNDALGLDPSVLSYGSNKKAWWRCSNGHEWQASIVKRCTIGRGCPYCTNQKATVDINDLATTRPDLAAEWHPSKNGELNPQRVTKGSSRKVWWICPVCKGEWEAKITDRDQGTGCPYCANKKVLKGVNDLATKRPDIAAEWHPLKNGDLSPEDVTSGSNKKVWWICPQGHEYEAHISSRTSRGDGCPYCSGRKVIKGETDLLTKYPEIAAEWDYEKNSGTDLTPDSISYGSSYKAWWICPNGHEYEMKVSKRTLRGDSCPICSGHKTVPGINDFATVYPDIAKEWHPTKNGEARPDQFSKNNGFKAWWLCQYGHEWQATIRDRSYGTGCPYCSARRMTSFPEQAIFYYVSQLCPDAQSRYKDAFDNGMELDIYIPSIRLGIEFDGGYWHSGEDSHKKEAEKYRLCKRNNISLLRVKEYNDEEWHDVADNIFYVNNRNNAELQIAIQTILNSIDPQSSILTRDNPYIQSRVIVDLSRDENAIKEYLTPIHNSLVELRPDLAAEWNYEKNGNLRPEMFGINSNDRVWWKCSKCGHVWKAGINHRGGKRKTGCPECAKAIKGESFTKNRVAERGSLAENNPKLAAEWHPNKNGKLTPNDITEKRFKKVWWLCPVCGYEWQASPLNRSKGIGCPCCSGRVPKTGVNDLKTVNPALAAEWDYEKNEDLRPEFILPGSGKKVWWKCSECGHEWQAIINSRSKGAGCPNCNRIERKAKKSKPIENQIEFDF